MMKRKGIDNLFNLFSFLLSKTAPQNSNFGICLRGASWVFAISNWQEHDSFFWIRTKAAQQHAFSDASLKSCSWIWHSDDTPAYLGILRECIRCKWSQNNFHLTWILTGTASSQSNFASQSCCIKSFAKDQANRVGQTIWRWLTKFDFW